MDDDGMPPPIRLMNFVSEDQLNESRRTRGARVEDGTAQRDRSLYEILQENKDKKDAEFNERFKHRPPKALDEDETEFFDKLEMSRKEYERQIANEEEQQLQSFHAAVAAQANTDVHELKEAHLISKDQEKKPVAGKKNASSLPLGMLIKVKPQAKKARVDRANAGESPSVVILTSATEDTFEPEEAPRVETIESVSSVGKCRGDGEEPKLVAISSLVSYSDESEDED